MKINDIYESTTSGSIAPVSMPMTGGVQSRSGVGKGVYSTKKVGNLTDKKPGKFVNSIRESKQIEEAHLDEEELIIVPGQGHKIKSGFIPHAEDRRDHEVSMARSDLFQAAKNAKQTFEMLEGVSEDDGIEGWVQAKITKAADYLATVREYLEGKQVQGMAEGVVAAGAVGESSGDVVKKVFKKNGKPFGEVGTDEDGKYYMKCYPFNIDYSNYDSYEEAVAELKHCLSQVNEGAKVDRMVKHIEKSEETAGKSKKEAENIAWATLNKRGYLDNANRKNKK